MIGSPPSPRAASIATRCSSALGTRFAELTTAQWLDLLRGVVPIAPVRSLSQALDVDELQERGHARRIPGRSRSGACGPWACRCTSRGSRRVSGRSRAGCGPGAPSSPSSAMTVTTVDRLRAAGAFGGDPRLRRGSIRPTSRRSR